MGEVYGLTVEAFSGIDKELSDMDQIPLNHYALQSILVPGHSPGSLSFYSPEGGFVITGDALFQGSIGRTDLPGGDYDTLIHSIRTRLLTLPPETIVYPGHGEPSTIGNESATNPFLTMVE
jgi:glyoxylase-like metal-dependent hydrolase (beta-lactamase superfamily II)